MSGSGSGIGGPGSGNSWFGCGEITRFGLFREWWFGGWFGKSGSGDLMRLPWRGYGASVARAIGHFLAWVARAWCGLVLWPQPFPPPARRSTRRGSRTPTPPRHERRHSDAGGGAPLRSLANRRHRGSQGHTNIPSTWGGGAGRDLSQFEGEGALPPVPAK
eukprot:gene18103-biopygen15954